MAVGRFMKTLTCNQTLLRCRQILEDPNPNITGRLMKHGEHRSVTERALAAHLRFLPFSSFKEVN